MRFKKLARKIGLPGEIHLHSLRHTTASLLINSDVPPKLIAEQLGHASASITQDIYSHIFASSRARAAQALEIALAPKTEERDTPQTGDRNHPGNGLIVVAGLSLKSSKCRLFFADNPKRDVYKRQLISCK